MTARRDVGVLTVDDHAGFRAAARQVIEATDGFEPLGEAASGEEALAIAGALDPDLVLIDVRMTGLDGLETARRFKSEHPRSLLVLVSTEDPPAGASACGASALIRKECFGPSELRRLWGSHGVNVPAG